MPSALPAASHHVELLSIVIREVKTTQKQQLQGCSGAFLVVFRVLIPLVIEEP
jgi:hypothetical protein